MRRVLIILFSLIAFANIAKADKVTEQQALEKAKSFMAGKRFLARSGTRGLNSTLQDTHFYVFNTEDNDGFVIVSGDDRTEAILGYSDHGRLDMDNMPDNFRYWLDCYEEQIKRLDNGYMVSPKAGTRSVRTAIEPLIKTAWNQSSPYNLQCPVVDEKETSTGCVATALTVVAGTVHGYDGCYDSGTLEIPTATEIN